MSLFDNPESVLMLRDLLNPPQARNDSDLDSDVEEPTRRIAQNPHSSSVRIVNSQKPEAANVKTEEKKQPQSVEEWQELQEREDAEILETRKTPEYHLTYRQAVGTEDVFLQMSNRSPASSSCEDMVLDIKLTDETVGSDKMGISITETELELSTPIYYLKFPLPHPVKVDSCNAKYNTDNKTLFVTLRLNRELDCINF